MNNNIKMDLFSLQPDICPYSIYSLQFYLVFASTRFAQFIKLPSLIGYLTALVGPILILNFVIKFVTTNSNYITLIKHSQQHKSNHPHSSAVTLGVILRSIILGILLNIGLSFVLNDYVKQQQSLHLIPLGLYLILLSFFHFSEYFVTSLTNPSTLNLSSFLIDQSTAYILAISGSLIEFLIEAYLFPKLKQFHLIISTFGLLLAICGELIRKCAMFTAGKNFSHTISSTKSPEHQLITHGIYSIFRHPSYAGWFYWAVGTQILLLNPICTILFAVISNNFFKDRIRYEEETLVVFFKEDYENYRKRVNLWMPSW